MLLHVLTVLSFYCLIVFYCVGASHIIHSYIDAHWISSLGVLEVKLL